MRFLLILFLLILILYTLCGIKRSVSPVPKTEVIEKVDTTFKIDTTFNEYGIRIPENKNPVLKIDSSINF